MQDGNAATRPDPRIVAEQPDVVLAKTAPSSFLWTAGAPFPRASIIDALSPGFRVQVPKDRMGDQDKIAHEQNLRDVGRRYADIIDSDGAVATIET